MSSSFSTFSSLSTFSTTTSVILRSRIRPHEYSATLSLLPFSVNGEEKMNDISLFATQNGGGGLFGEQSALSSKARQIQYDLPSTAEWQIFVDQSKQSLDKGGAAVLDAFCCLAPPSKVQVVPAILPKQSSTTGGGGGGGSSSTTTAIRCISKVPGRSNMEVANVDSVDKVYRVLTKHLQVKNVNPRVREALKWKYKGNGLLERDDTKGAIRAYNEALRLLPSPTYSSSSQSLSSSSSSSSNIESKQVGAILLLRSAAYAQQGEFHKDVLQKSVDEWEQRTSEELRGIVESICNNEDDNGNNNNLDDPSSSSSSSSLDQYASVAVRLAMLEKLQQNGPTQKRRGRSIWYRHGLYQISLLHAVRDALRATEILPTYSTAWIRAGQLLSDLWKLTESRQYYEMAASIDSSLLLGNVDGDGSSASDEQSGSSSSSSQIKRNNNYLETILKELDEQQALLTWAFDQDGGSDDASIRLALDVAA